jgi:hypothetical protein
MQRLTHSVRKLTCDPFSRPSSTVGSDRRSRINAKPVKAVFVSACILYIWYFLYEQRPPQDRDRSTKTSRLLTSSSVMLQPRHLTGTPRTGRERRVNGPHFGTPTCVYVAIFSFEVQLFLDHIWSSETLPRGHSSKEDGRRGPTHGSCSSASVFPRCVT